MVLQDCTSADLKFILFTEDQRLSKPQCLLFLPNSCFYQARLYESMRENVTKRRAPIGMPGFYRLVLKTRAIGNPGHVQFVCMIVLYQHHIVLSCSWFKWNELDTFSNDVSFRQHCLPRFSWPSIPCVPPAIRSVLAHVVLDCNPSAHTLYTCTRKPALTTMVPYCLKFPACTGISTVKRFMWVSIQIKLTRPSSISQLCRIKMLNCFLQ